MAKVTVIVPVFNVEPYLRECMDSVVNQTLTDLEIICVFTHSKDRSEEILEEYAARDSRIQLVNRDDGGLAEARNVGLRIATGEYVAFLDSDDYWDLTFCEKTYNAAKAADADMLMIYFQCFGEIDKDSPARPHQQLAEFHDDIEKLEVEYTNWQTAWCNVYRTEFLQRNEMEFHYDLIFEDVPFVTKGALVANKLVVLPEVLQYYRQRGSSQMQQAKYFIQRIRAYNLMLGDVIPLQRGDAVLHWLLARKFESMFFTRSLVGEHYADYCALIREDVSDEHYALIEGGKLDISEPARLFFMSLMGSRPAYWLASARYKVFNAPALLSAFVSESLLPNSKPLQWVYKIYKGRAYEA